MEFIALAPAIDDHVCVLFAAYSVPIMHFSGDSVGIRGCVPLKKCPLVCSPKPVVLENHEQIVETVNAIPHEWISERIVDILSLTRTSAITNPCAQF